MADTPQVGKTITGPDGQLRVWVPDDTNSRNWEYLQQASGFQSAEEALQADLDSGQGSYVPASYVEKMPMAMKIFIATGLASMGITGGMALAGGLAGGGGAAGSGYVGADIASVAAHGAGPAVAGAAGGGGTAGTIGTLGKLGTVGQVLMGGAQGAATGREREALINQQRDELRQRQAESERANSIAKGNLEVNQKTTGQDLESQARSQAAWGQFAQNPGNKFIPDSIKGKFGSGMDYSPFAPIGDDAYRAAQQRLVSGSDKQFTPQPNVPTPPLTPQQNESTWEKIQRLAGMGLGLAGSFSNYRAPTGRT